MLGRGNTGAALGSEAVDAEFWALICQDEEWLNAEFDAVVSDADGNPRGHPARQLPATTANRHRAGPAWWVPGGRPWRDRDAAGQAVAAGARPASRDRCELTPNSRKRQVEGR